jgi:predicted DNA-binding transcriptional regulator YafY
MPKSPNLHSYSDQVSFDRLLVLIATLVRHPGVGSRSAKVTNDQDSLESVQQHMQLLADNLGLQLPHCSVHTLRKDLVTLRAYGILDRHRHDWGYYLGSGALNREELQIALNALLSQATYQGDAQARRIYQSLSQRLKPLNLESNGELFYPVRAHLNRAIVHTDPEEMMRQRQSQDTLFHQLAALESAMLQGLPIELYLAKTPYKTKSVYRKIYPLQLLYHDVAWYLVMEDCENGHLAISRVDRFKNYLKPLDDTGRGLDVQQKSLNIAHQLLHNGWGLNLGNPTDQQLERQGKLPLTTVKVRFFSPACEFVREGERRHPKQKIVVGPKDEQTGELAYLDYSVKLPERSLNEFSLWVARHLENAQVLAPLQLVEKHRESAQRSAARYTS